MDSMSGFIIQFSVHKIITINLDSNYSANKFISLSHPYEISHEEGFDIHVDGCYGSHLPLLRQV